MTDYITGLPGPYLNLPRPATGQATSPPPSRVPYSQSRKFTACSQIAVDSYVEGTSEEPSMAELQAIEEQIEEITNEFYYRINDHAATIGLSDAYSYRFEKWGGKNTIILRKYDS